MKKIVFFLFIGITLAYSHSGRTNSAGCHNDNINGGYHCHKSNESLVDTNLVSEKVSDSTKNTHDELSSDKESSQKHEH